MGNAMDQFLGGGVVRKDILKNLGLSDLDVVQRNGTWLRLGQSGSWDNSVI